MAFLFGESFDLVNAPSQLGNRWTGYTNNSPSVTTAITAGRTNNSWETSNQFSAKYDYAWKDLGVSRTTLVLGFAFKLTNVVAGVNFAGFYDTGGSDWQVYLQYTSSRTIQVTRGDGTVLGTSSTLADNTWYYLELKVTIDNTTGSWELKINGATDISGSGVDTQNTANATADRVYVGPQSGYKAELWFDDVYVVDDQGTANNDSLGAIKIYAVQPDADGVTTQWTPQGGGANYVEVDETPPDDDTTYVEASTVGDKDLYGFAALGVSGVTVNAVQLSLHARQTDTGTRTIAGVARSGTTELDGGNQSITTNYRTYLEVYETDPDTSTAWTVPGIDAAQFGAKLTA